jgi:ribonucleotide monophosphatase NagD (HAD superfamily)
LTRIALQDEIFTSAYASAAYLKTVLNFPEDKKVYVIGERGVEEELDAVGIKHSGGTVRFLSFSAPLSSSLLTLNAYRTRRTTFSST